VLSEGGSAASSSSSSSSSSSPASDDSQEDNKEILIRKQMLLWAKYAKNRHVTPLPQSVSKNGLFYIHYCAPSRIIRNLYQKDVIYVCYIIIDCMGSHKMCVPAVGMFGQVFVSPGFTDQRG
jgi:hypothetical protein